MILQAESAEPQAVRRLLLQQNATIWAPQLLDFSSCSHS